MFHHRFTYLHRPTAPPDVASLGRGARPGALALIPRMPRAWKRPKVMVFRFQSGTWAISEQLWLLGTPFQISVRNWHHVQLRKFWSTGMFWLLLHICSSQKFESTCFQTCPLKWFAAMGPCEVNIRKPSMGLFCMLIMIISDICAY